MEGTAAIEVANLTVSYGSSVVLDNVSANVAANRWTALLGRNGAGKSTLISAIVGIGPGSDSVTFPGNTGQRARFCAYVSQSPVLPPGMTVAEYVLIGRTAHLGWFQSEAASDRERAHHAMEQLDVAELASRYLGDLSGGEAQRAVLARALCQDARILVLDEPTSSLDIGHQLEVLDLVAELAQQEGMSVLSAVHDLTAAARYTDDAILLDEGSVVAAGPTAEILTAEILTRHYRTPMHRMDGPDGQPIVVPLNVSTSATLGDPTP